MSDQSKKIRLEGIVHASRYDSSASGKQFLGAAIECSDATVWVVDYEEQSPFHLFAGRQVVATGEPYEPEGQYLIDWGEGKTLGHFRVSSMRLAEVARDAELVEVGAGYGLRGQFERSVGHPGESVLSFVTDRGDVFAAANHPAGVSVGRSVEVWANPVQPSPSMKQPPGRYLWIICPYSAADLSAWRGTRS